jgi:hypothetical protein
MPASRAPKARLRAGRWSSRRERSQGIGRSGHLSVPEALDPRFEFLCRYRGVTSTRRTGACTRHRPTGRINSPLGEFSARRYRGPIQPRGELASPAKVLSRQEGALARRSRETQTAQHDRSRVWVVASGNCIQFAEARARTRSAVQAAHLHVRPRRGIVAFARHRCMNSCGEQPARRIALQHVAHRVDRLALLQECMTCGCMRMHPLSTGPQTRGRTRTTEAPPISEQAAEGDSPLSGRPVTRKVAGSSPVIPAKPLLEAKKWRSPPGTSRFR